MKIRLKNSSYIVIDTVRKSESNLMLLTEQECRQLEKIGSRKRRDEWSTWRYMVREELGGDTEIAYTPEGCPTIRCCNGEQWHVSVSHSPTHVAVMFSREICGMDMELLNRDFGRIRGRYLSPQDVESGETGRFEAVAWCAKEAIYKFLGGRVADLRNNVNIREIDWNMGTLRAETQGKRLPELTFTEYERHIICSLSASPSHNTSADQSS